MNSMAGTGNNDLGSRLEFAVGTARAAGEYAFGYFQSGELTVETKDDGSPVSRADKDAEHLIRARLEASFPQDAVLGEEFGQQTGSTGYRWYLDPIDGTESFVRGVPLWGTMIGLELDDEPVAGVVVFPALREIIWAATGLGAWWSNNVTRLKEGESFPPEIRSAHVSDVSDIDAAMMSVTSVKGFDEEHTMGGYNRLRKAVSKDRGWSDCYGYLLVATGRVDIHIDPQMSVWDVAPMPAIIKESGGQVTDRTGNQGINLDNLVATNGRLHDRVLKLLNG